MAAKKKRTPKKTKSGKKALKSARNQLEALVHSVRKSLKEYGDKLDKGEAEKIEAAAKEAEEALKTGDKAKIDAQAESLGKAAQKLGEKMYADQQAAQAAAGGAAPGGGGTNSSGGSEGGKKDDGDVVDAEFTEVKDAKK